MTTQAEIQLRNKISMGMAGPSEIHAAIAVAARCLGAAVYEWDYEAMERHACFIRDLSAFLQKNPAGVAI